jgi:hypothetical protein
MINFKEAFQIATDYVAQELTDSRSNRFKLAIDANHVIEKKYGWIFTYNTERFLETEEIEDMVFGGGPFLVYKADGAIYQFWSGDSLDNQLREFELSHHLDSDE